MLAYMHWTKRFAFIFSFNPCSNSVGLALILRMGILSSEMPKGWLKVTQLVM